MQVGWEASWTKNVNTAVGAGVGVRMLVSRPHQSPSQVGYPTCGQRSCTHSGLRQRKQGHCPFRGAEAFSSNIRDERRWYIISPLTLSHQKRKRGYLAIDVQGARDSVHILYPKHLALRRIISEFVFISSLVVSVVTSSSAQHIPYPFFQPCILHSSPTTPMPNPPEAPRPFLHPQPTPYLPPSPQRPTLLLPLPLRW